MACSGRGRFSLVLMVSVAAAMIAALCMATVAAAAENCSLSDNMLSKCANLEKVTSNASNPFPFLDCCNELKKKSGQCLCDAISAVEKEVGSAISLKFCSSIESELKACAAKTCSFTPLLEEEVSSCLKESESLHLPTPAQCCGPLSKFGPGCICDVEKMVRAKAPSFDIGACGGLKRPSGGCPN